MVVSTHQVMVVHDDWMIFFGSMLGNHHFQDEHHGAVFCVFYMVILLDCRYITTFQHLRIWDDAKRQAKPWCKQIHFGHVFGSRMLMLACDFKKSKKGF